MASKGEYWTTQKRDGSWSVQRSGSSRSTSIHDTQAAAWKEARRLARGAGADAFLKGSDGTIHASNSYKDDASPSQG